MPKTSILSSTASVIVHTFVFSTAPGSVRILTTVVMICGSLRMTKHGRSAVTSLLVCYVGLILGIWLVVVH